MKKTKRKKTPAVLPIPKKKKPVAGRTAQTNRKAAPVKKSRASKPRAKKQGKSEETLPEWERIVLEQLEVKRRETRRLEPWEVCSEDPPPVPPVEGEPLLYLPIRDMTPAQPTLPHESDGMGFTWNFIPLDASQRRARKGLLRQWVATKDPFVAEALRRQEGIEIPYREALWGLFGNYGKHGIWREAMIMEAKHDKECREELGQVLSSFAVRLDSNEFDAFSEAVESVSRVEKKGPVNRKFVCGLMFVLRCQIETGCLPPQNKVREFLKKSGMPVDGSRNNESRDLFKGPIMGTLPKGKAGAPRGPRGPRG